MAEIHPSTAHVLQFFKYEHLPDRLQFVSRPFHRLAHDMAHGLPQGPELTVGLRKLLEAKDCAVRAKLLEPVEPPLEKAAGPTQECELDAGLCEDNCQGPRPGWSCRLQNQGKTPPWHKS